MWIRLWTASAYNPSTFPLHSEKNPNSLSRSMYLCWPLQLLSCPFPALLSAFLVCELSHIFPDVSSIFCLRVFTHTNSSACISGPSTFHIQGSFLHFRALLKTYLPERPFPISTLQSRVGPLLLPWLFSIFVTCQFPLEHLSPIFHRILLFFVCAPQWNMTLMNYRPCWVPTGMTANIQEVSGKRKGKKRKASQLPFLNLTNVNFPCLPLVELHHIPLDLL